MRKIETEKSVDIYEKYPAHPEERMSDSQYHYNAMTRLYDNLRMMFEGREHNVGIFCDLAWYPTESEDWMAPDVMVVFGVPQDRKPGRKSYAEPLEGYIDPAVVFELSSLSKTPAEVERKRVWYQTHGVQEYYWIDEMRNHVDVFIRKGDELVAQAGLTEWISPLLGIRFTWSNVPEVRIYRPNWTLMRSSVDYLVELRARTQRAELLEQVARRNQRLLAFIRQQGIEPPPE